MAYCTNCGTEVDSVARFCASCGTPTDASVAAPRPGAPAVAQTRTNGFAVASMVLGIVWVYAIGSILALVFGYIARSQIRSDPTMRGQGMAIAGIVLGYVGIVGTILLFVVIVASGDAIDDVSLGLWAGQG